MLCIRLQDANATKGGRGGRASEASGTGGAKGGSGCGCREGEGTAEVCRFMEQVLGFRDGQASRSTLSLLASVCRSIFQHHLLHRHSNFLIKRHTGDIRYSHQLLLLLKLFLRLQIFRPRKLQDVQIDKVQVNNLLNTNYLPRHQQAALCCLRSSKHSPSTRNEPQRGLFAISTALPPETAGLTERVNVPLEFHVMLISSPSVDRLRFRPKGNLDFDHIEFDQAFCCRHERIFSRHRRPTKHITGFRTGSSLLLSQLRQNETNFGVK